MMRFRWKSSFILALRFVIGIVFEIAHIAEIFDIRQVLQLDMSQDVSYLDSNCLHQPHDSVLDGIFKVMPFKNLFYFYIDIYPLIGLLKRFV